MVLSTEMATMLSEKEHGRMEIVFSFDIFLYKNDDPKLLLLKNGA
jgi:hypothetical protein